MEHPKRIGDRTTLAVMLALTSAGLDVAVPFGENCRYDLVVDQSGRLSRVQCKTGRLRDGAVHFSTASTYGHLPSPREARRDYQGQIDAFGVYCPGTRGVYLIPLGDVAARCTAYSRVTAPPNGQRKGIRFAAAYEIARITCALDALRARELAPAAIRPPPGITPEGDTIGV